MDYQANQNGSATIVVRGTSNGQTVDDAFVVTVNPVNDAPILTSIGNQSTNEDTDLTINLSGTDVDIATNSQTLTYSATSNDETLVKVNTTSSANNGTLTFDVQDNQNGNANITVTITDSEGLTDTETIALTVNPVNDAPTAVDDNYIAIEDIVLQGNVLSNDSDVDSGTGPNSHAQLTAELINNVSNGSLTLNSDGTFGYLGNSNYNGSDSFTYKLNDSAGGLDTGKVTILISPINDDPVANIIKSSIVSVVLEDSTKTTVTLDASDSFDLDENSPSDSLRFSWTQLIGSSLSTLPNTPSFNINVAPGIYQFKVVVTDDSSAVDSDTIDVRIGKPILSIDEYVFVQKDNNKFISLAYKENSSASLARKNSQIIVKIPQALDGIIEFDVNQNNININTQEIILNQVLTNKNELYFDVSPTNEFLSNGFEALIDSISFITKQDAEKFSLELAIIDQGFGFQKDENMDHTNNKIRVGSPQFDFNSNQVFVLSDGVSLILDTLTYKESNVAGVGLKNRGIDIILPSGNYNWSKNNPGLEGDAYAGYLYKGDTLHIQLARDMNADDSFILTTLQLNTAGVQSPLSLNLMVNNIDNYDDITDYTIRVGQPSLEFDSVRDLIYHYNQDNKKYPDLIYSENGVAGTATIESDIQIDIPEEFEAIFNKDAIISLIHSGSKGSIGQNPLITDKTINIDVIEDLGADSKIIISGGSDKTSGWSLNWANDSYRDNFELRVNGVGNKDAETNHHIRRGSTRFGISSLHGLNNTNPTVKDQIFMIDEKGVLIEPIVIKENSVEAVINSYSDIRIVIPDSMSAIWNSTPTDISGNASNKVGVPDIRDNGKTLFIPVKENNDFVASDELKLSGATFDIQSLPSSKHYLELHVNIENSSSENPDSDWNDKDGNGISVSATTVELTDNLLAIINDSSILLPAIQIKESDIAAGILFGEYISVKLTNPNITWNSDITQPSFSGNMASNVNPTVTYSSNNNLMYVQPTGNFENGGDLEIKGLKINASNTKVFACSLSISIRTGSEHFLAQNNTNVIKISNPSFSSTATQRIHVDKKSIKLNPFVIKNDPDIPSLDVDRLITIISPNDAIWDTSISIISFSGSARYRVNNEVIYNDNATNAMISIQRKFLPSDSLIINDLRLKPINKTADSSNFYLSVPIIDQQISKNIIDPFSIKFGRTTVSMPSQSFIKGMRKISELGSLVIKEGNHSSFIDPTTDIKLILDQNLHLKWVSNQTLSTADNAMKNKIRLQDAFIDQTNGIDNILIIPVDKKFANSDSLKITGLKVLNNSSFDDSSTIGYINILFGEYGSSDYYTNQNDSLILSAPKLTMDNDLYILAGDNKNYNLPMIVLKDDLIPILKKDYEYRLSLPNNLNANWVTTNLVKPDEIKNINLVGNNLVFELSNSFTKEKSINISGLGLSGDFEPDSLYNIYLFDPDKKDTLAVNNQKLISGKPALNFDQNQFWLDTLLVKSIDQLVIEESYNSIMPSKIKIINTEPGVLSWFNISAISIEKQPNASITLEQDSVIIINNLTHGIKQLMIKGLNFKLNPDVFNDPTNAKLNFPIKIHYESPYNTMPWLSADSLQFKPSPIISLPTYFSTSTDSGYIELIINQKFIFNNESPSSADFNFKLYNNITNEVIINSNLEGMKISPLETFTSISDANFTLFGLQRIQYDITDSLITAYNKVFEDYPNKISASINFTGSAISNTVNKPSDTPNKLWDFNWGAIDPAMISLNQKARYYNPDSTDFVINLGSNYKGDINIKFAPLLSDDSFPDYNISYNDYVNKASIPKSHFINNELPEGPFKINLSLVSTNNYSFPIEKNIIIDKTAPTVTSIRPLPGLREDKISGHIISNSDTLSFELKEAPLWEPNTKSGFLFSDSVSYGMEIIMNNIDTVYIETGRVKMDNYFTTKLSYDLKKVLPAIKEGPMNVQLMLYDNAGNINHNSYLFTLASSVSGKKVADKMFNYPNPFSISSGSGTKIRYTLLSSNASGKLIVLDSSGDLVFLYKLTASELTAGTHIIEWNGLSIFGNTLAPGVYFGFLDFNGQIIRSKIAVIN